METKHIGTPPANKVLIEKPTNNDEKKGIFDGFDLKEPKQSVVLGVGSGIFDLDVGDTIIHPDGVGTTFQLEDKVYMILRYQDILLIK